MRIITLPKLQAGRMSQLANELGRNGRKNVVERYSWEVFFREFDKHLKKVSKRG